MVKLLKDFSIFVLKLLEIEHVLVEMLTLSLLYCFPLNCGNKGVVPVQEINTVQRHKFS